jgi:two-component system chemotaxis response regulator CheB
VAIGASTGGPQALREILTQLPATFPLSILIVQHITPGFETSMINWLGPQCALPIQLASDKTPLNGPAIYVASVGHHLITNGRVLELTNDPPIHGHRPSASTLFRSVASDYGSHAIGVLLSGMGEDGASGLRDIKAAGGVTMAQDEATSVVFGMPGAAIAMGAVDQVLPPQQIGRELVKLASRAAR